MIEEIHLRANQLGFRALAAGPPDGVPVLLLHGFPEGAESWRDQVEALGRAGFRAVAPDLRGYGGTDAPEDEDAYTIEELVADAAGLIDVLGGRAHVAGHDWGALIGWTLASQHRDRVLSWSALSVGHPVPVTEAALTDPDQKHRSEYIGLLRMRGKAEAVLAEDGYRRLRAMYQGALPEADVERHISDFSRPGRLTAALNYYRVALPKAALAASAVRVPTILVWGDRDPALGRRQAERTAAHVEAPYQLHVLEGAGHWLQNERPQEVSRLILDHCQAAADG